MERSLTEWSGGCGDNQVIAPPRSIRADTTPNSNDNESRATPGEGVMLAAFREGR